MKRWLPHDADVPEEPVERAIYYLATARAALMLKGTGHGSLLIHIALVPDEHAIPVHYDGQALHFKPDYVLTASEEELIDLWRDIAYSLRLQ